MGSVVYLRLTRSVRVTFRKLRWYSSFFYSKISHSTFQKLSCFPIWQRRIHVKGAVILAGSRQLVVQQKRFRSKINIQRPQKLFYERALVTKFVTPYYEREVPFKPIWEACTVALPKVRNEKEIHPYQRIIARECLQRFDDSRMVAFLHKNSMRAESIFDLTVALHKSGMTLKLYGRGILRTALQDTRYETILPLFNAPTFVVFGAEPNVEVLRKIVKKTPEVFLLAGILDGKLLSLDDFLKYGKINITEARSRLVHTLQTAGGINLNRQLNHHQSTLVSRLEQIGKNSKTDGENAQGDGVSTE